MNPTRRSKTGRRSAVVTSLLAFALTGCAGFNRGIDAWGLELKAGAAVAHPLPKDLSPLPYQSDAELERLTRPAELPEVRVEPSSRLALGIGGVIEEKLDFESAVRLRLEGSQRAVAHLYRQGRLGERPVLLWVPGQAIQESDFPSLGEYFRRALERGYDVVFYVPPYHLERTPPGFASGDAFLATDFADHLSVFAQELSDLRRLVGWLRAQGARTVGAFGSSMGGGLLLKLVTWDATLDFLLLKQPLVDWNHVLSLPQTRPVRARIAGQGVSDEELGRAYLALDARHGRPRLSPERIALFCGRFDAIASPERTASLARLWGIERVRVYRRGHSFITFGGETYRAVGLALEEERRAAGWDPEPAAPTGEAVSDRPSLIGE